MEEEAKNTTASEADALKILLKTTEEMEAPMTTETWEREIKKEAEMHKRLEMVSE